MRRAAAVFLVTVLLAGTLGCGAVQVTAFFGTNQQTVSGFVAAVHLSNVPGSGGALIQVTVVSLQQPSTITTATFCGNLVSQFPVNSFVQVNFTPGQFCGTIVFIQVG